MEFDRNKLSEISLNIIIKAGDARAFVSDAVTCAKQEKMDEAQGLLEKAEKSMNEAHQLQTDMLVQNARAITNGEEPLLPDILMVHAQDHFNAALLSIDFGKEIVALYQEINALKK